MTVTPTKNDAEFDRLSVERNTRHGIQLSIEEKRKKAVEWFTGDHGEISDIARILSVDRNTVGDWVKRKKKDLESNRLQRIMDFWMACYTNEEIAKQVQLSPPTVSNLITEETKECKLFSKFKSLSDYADPDWQPPLYSEWKLKQKTNKTGHFGNTEVSFVDNLLYMFTNPFDIVIDPFAGGGSTIDICKTRKMAWRVGV